MEKQYAKNASVCDGGLHCKNAYIYLLHDVPHKLFLSSVHRVPSMYRVAPIARFLLVPLQFFFFFTNMEGRKPRWSEMSEDEDGPVVGKDSASDSERVFSGTTSGGKWYWCNGYCNEKHQLSMLLIKGWPDSHGEYIPGKDWNGNPNRLCFECNIATYHPDITDEQKQEMQDDWKRDCKRSLRKATKCNERKKERACKDRVEAKRKFSEKQKERASNWSLLQKEIKEEHPGESLSKQNMRRECCRRIKTIVSCVRSSLSTLGPVGEEMLAEARKVRIELLESLVNTMEGGPPHGRIHEDQTLQFLSDMTPDGKNKDLFLCRYCGLVASNHVWHQALGTYGPKHHFRCRYCHGMYSPWQQDERFCKFNKVLVNVDPDDATKCHVTPAYWAETAEQSFVNVMKEFSLKFQMKGGDLKIVNYNNVSQFIENKLASTFKQPAIFKMIQVPAQYAEQVSDLNTCKGFEHCSTKPQLIEAFFFEKHKEVTQDMIFTDFEILCNEIASCLNASA